MAKLSLNFVERSGRFCLCATIVGTTTRHYRVVHELKNADMTLWDKKAQKFQSRRKEDAKNNKILKEILETYQSILKERDFNSGKELFDFHKKSLKKKKRSKKPKTVAPKKEAVQPAKPVEIKQYASYDPNNNIILRDWLNHLIQQFKNPKRLKPSSSYQPYKTLLNKLEIEGDLINRPVSTLGDESYIQLINWVNKHPCKRGKGNNFIGVMKIFTAALNKARKARLTQYVPDYPYMDYAPMHTISDKAEDLLLKGGDIKSLTEDQYQTFIEMDLSEIKPSLGSRTGCDKELYRDFCMLLYEMKSRPIDILRLHWDNIAFDPHSGKYTCAYIPAKKKNYGASSKHTSKALAIQYLSDKAVEIIMKYKDKSKGGYVFPFALNDRKWDFNIPGEYHYHYYKGNHICGRINNFLHEIGKALKLPFTLTLYVFRRTAITQAIIDNKIPLAMIAKIAGTSLEMLEAHYTNHLHALAAY